MNEGWSISRQYSTGILRRDNSHQNWANQYDYDIQTIIPSSRHSNLCHATVCRTIQHSSSQAEPVIIGGALSQFAIGVSRVDCENSKRITIRKIIIQPQTRGVFLFIIKADRAAILLSACDPSCLVHMHHAWLASIPGTSNP